MTPNDIDVLLHYYTSSGPHPRLSAPAVLGAVEAFCGTGILEPVPDNSIVGLYKTTERGNALVEAICRTPLPKAAFIDPRTKEVL